MADIANLVLAVDSSAVTKGTAALDGLAASGARAEAATVGLSGGFKGAGAEASAMAAAAQLSARAAVDQAAGFGAATNAARVNTMAMRESLVVAREISRGNFTRLPGSLTLLAQGIGSQGGIGAFASAMAAQLGLIRKVQDADLAEAATAAASAAAGVEAAARKAGANILAADTEVALAQAQLRVAEGATAEAAAQARVAAANEAVTAAAAEAAIAENALATAQGRAAETGAASAAATRTLIGGSGIGLLGIATVGGLAYAAIKQFQDQIKDSGSLDTFAESLNLTDEQIKKLGGSVTYLGDRTREISGLTVSFGDVMHGVWQEIGREAGASGTWDKVKSGASTAFSGVLSAWDKASAGLSAGLYMFEDIGKTIFNNFAAIVGNAFVSGVNLAIGAINKLSAAASSGINALILGAHNLLGTPAGSISISPLQTMDNPYAARAGAALSKTFNIQDYYSRELAANHAAFAGVETGAVQNARNRLQKLSDGNRPKKPKQPKKPKRNAADDEIAKLTAEIKGQNELASAYLAGDAAAIKAEADQKALTLAVEKHATAAQTAALKEKELALAVATGSAQAAKKANDLGFEVGERTRLNTAVQAGTLTMTQANEQLKLDTELRPYVALYAVAEGQAKAKLGTIIAALTKNYADNNVQIQVEQALKAKASNDNEIARLQLETSLIGASNKERAVAIAQLEAMQQLQTMPGLNPQQQQNYVQSAINKAAAGVQTPFQQWAQSIHTSLPGIQDDLQSIAFKGFDNLASSIAGVVTGTQSLGKAFKNISTQIIGDIVQMTVKMLLFRAISSVFGSIGGGGGFGGVTSLPTSFSGVPHWASGGSMIIGGNSGVDQNVLSLNGSPMAMVGQGETLSVTPNRPPANNNGRQQIELTIVTAPSDEAWGKVSNISARQIGAAAPIIIKQAASSTIKVITRPHISGGR